MAKDSYRIQERWTVGVICAAGLLIALVSLWIGFAIDRHFPNCAIAQYTSFIIKSLGQLIGITGVLAFLSDRFGQISIFRQFSNELTEKMRNLVFEDLANVQAVGIRNVQQEIKFEELFRNLRPHDELYVLSTYLSASLHNELLDPAQDAARMGVRLRFLVMSPDSPLLSMRVKELAEHELSPHVFKEGVKRFLAELVKRQKRVANERKDKTDGFFQIAQYNDLIGSPVYLIRRNGKPVLAYSSFYFGRPIDRGTVPYFEWIDKGKDSLIYQIDSYVIAKWERWFKKPDESSAA